VNEIAHENLLYQMRSENLPLTPKSVIYIVDTFGKFSKFESFNKISGETGAFYSLQGVVLLGGSLIPDIGGHSPIEPGHFGCPILSGPYVSKNQGLFDSMKKMNKSCVIEVKYPL
jgi:3-deoxy-D-manno-octulosonic-acid transferase